MYYYETHLHTFPVSRCARTEAKETVEFYKAANYDGIFVTNHFLDGNINIDRSRPYDEKIRFYFSDFHKAAEEGEKIGLKVFDGVETTYGGTDFLVYGLHEDWYLAHPEIMEMDKRRQLWFMRDEGALIFQAHPFREDHYIDHTRLYPDAVEGIEVFNAGRRDRENKMAQFYADTYGFLQIAGSDNHNVKNPRRLAGIMTETPIESVDDFIQRMRAREPKLFIREVF